MFDPGQIDPGLRAPADLRLARIEEAGLNAAQPPEQLLFDGWLLRFSPGKARRARSVNAICAGRLDLPTKFTLCSAWYERHRLPLLFRITPFSMPAQLDEFLQRQRLIAVDETRVMTLDRISANDDGKCDVRSVDVTQFARAVGRLRGSSSTAIEAHQRRLLASALAQTSFRRVVFQGEQPIAAGQTVVESDVAGLYDIVTDARQRNRGLGSAISRCLLADAAAAGARTAYLQVDAGNAAARCVYTKLGFVDRYAYWYRQPADADESEFA